MTVREPIATPIDIVLVEDDPGHARLIQKNLRRVGVGERVIHLDNGRKALDLLLDQPEGSLIALRRPLVLLDLNMPEIGGVVVLERLKADARTRTIPVIVMTTTDDCAEIRRCYELGCNVYVTKPVDYAQLTNAVQQLGLFLGVVQVPVLED